MFVYTYVIVVFPTVVLAQLDLQSQFVVGNAGYGYTFALNDGKGGLIVASNNADGNPVVVQKTEIGTNNLIGQVSFRYLHTKYVCYFCFNLMVLCLL